jgi:phage FluMu protein Com
MARTSELEKSLMPADIVEYEIECPRCYGVMCLYSESESLVYACEDCDFILHTAGKRG